MGAPQEFNSLYIDVAENIARTLVDIAELKVNSKDGQEQLSKMTLQLRGIQASFNNELDFLQQHAEWDKFTIAFFGETNAGKSTIIESLRILFQEESRQNLLQQNEHDLVKFDAALTAHVEQLRIDLGRVYVEHASQVAEIRRGAGQLSAILKEESSARQQIARDESSARVAILEDEERARQQIAQDESSTRTAILEEEGRVRQQIARDESSARVNRKLLLVAIIGAAVGAGGTVLIRMTVGG